MLVYELQHSAFDRNHNALYEMAVKGKISRADFAKNCVRLEFQAAQKTQEFFRKHPLADGDSEENPRYVKMLQTPNEFAEYFRSLDSGKNFLFQHYLAWYDSLPFSQLFGGVSKSDGPK